SLRGGRAVQWIRSQGGMGWKSLMAMNPKKAEEARTFLISVAAELAGMHAQTLRTYDRLGLVSPQRTAGGGRRYSEHDVDLLREVQRLSQDEGVNLAGIKRIIELTNQVDALQSRLKEMAEELAVLRANQRREIAVVPKSTALVVWQPRSRR
ncbi:MAG: MerR family transcriptional regulator, heat shock protein HspR, partial [Mycobacterium sp.]|nr:MerR family transcriptional regulator, heat shock protein HspR [Mycobacterium sp.]